MGLRDKAKKFREALLRAEDEKPLVSDEEIELIDEGKIDEVIEGSSIREELSKQDAEIAISQTEEDIEFLKNRLLSFIAFGDFVKDVVSKGIDEIVDSTIFVLMGYVKASSLALLLRDIDSGRFYIKVSKDIPIDKIESLDFTVKNDLVTKVLETRSTLLTEELEDRGIIGEIRDRLLEANVKAVVPLLYEDEILGLILLGPKIEIEGEASYSRYEIEYLDLIGSVLGGILHKESSISELKEKGVLYKSILDILKEGGLIDSISDFVSSFKLILERDFGISVIFLFLENEEKNGFVLYNDDDVFISRDEPLLEKIISSQNGVFLRDEELRAFLDITGYVTDVENFIFVVPMYDREDRCFAFLGVGESDVISEDKYAAYFKEIKEVLSFYLYYLLERKRTESLFFDIYSSLERRINAELKKAKDFSVNLSLAKIRFRNLDRIYNLLGVKKFDEISSFIFSFFVDNLARKDFVYRIFFDEYLLVIPGKDKKETKRWLDDILDKLLDKIGKVENIKIVPKYDISTYPEDSDDIFFLLDFIR